MSKKTHLFIINAITAAAFAAFSLTGLKITFEGWEIGRAIIFAISGLWLMLYTCTHLDFKKLSGDEE